MYQSILDLPQRKTFIDIRNLADIKAQTHTGIAASGA